MNCKFLPLLLCALATNLALEADAQCRKFSKQRIISTLDADQMLDQMTAGTLGRGESAAALIEVEASGTVDLIISTHPDLGAVGYNVVNAQGGRIASGTVNGSVARLPIVVEADSDLIVHIQSERTTGAYTPLGCVSLATARTIPNEMDILMNE